MAMMMKYRICDVAKDFNVVSKVISQIMTDYVAKPKSHMQALDVPELDIIFEYMTQHNQVENLEDIFKVEAPAEKPAQQEEKPVEAQEKPAEQAGKQSAAGKKPAQSAQQQAKPAVPQQPAKKKENKPHVPR